MLKFPFLKNSQNHGVYIKTNKDQTYKGKPKSFNRERVPEKLQNMSKTTVAMIDDNIQQPQLSIQHNTKATTFTTHSDLNLDNSTMANSLWNIDTLETPSTIADNMPPDPGAVNLILQASTLALAAEAKLDAVHNIDKTLGKTQLEAESFELIIRAKKVLMEELKVKTRNLKEEVQTNDDVLKKATKDLAAIQPTLARLEKEAPIAADEYYAANDIALRMQADCEDEEQRKADKILDNGITIDHHRKAGTIFQEAMQNRFNYEEMSFIKSTITRNIISQANGILFIFFDFPFFLSQKELEILLGYVSPNHNVSGALELMLENKILSFSTDSIGTIQYCLGPYALNLLNRTVPNIEVRPDQFADSLRIRTQRGQHAINKRSSKSPSKVRKRKSATAVTASAEKKPKKQQVNSGDSDSDSDSDASSICKIGLKDDSNKDENERLKDPTFHV